MAILKYRKIGGGTFRLRSGKIVKPNEIFTADEHDIPETFANTVENLGPAGFVRKVKEVPPGEKSPEETKTETDTGDDIPQYEIQPRDGAKGWFNVVDAQGKILNEKALREDEAAQMLKALE